jgi:uncharacterized membrane protein (DUF373 family)
MRMKTEFAETRRAWAPLTFYQKFEQVCTLILTALIAIIVIFALWHLALKIIVSIAANSFDPTDYQMFQVIFGMIFIVIIALEFKRSLTGLAERQTGLVQVRTVILIGLLAVVRKLIILEPAATEAIYLFALAAATLSLGLCYWFVTR